MKLTPEAKAAMLAEYAADKEPLSVLAGRYGVSLSTINNHRRQAGLPDRLKTNAALVPVEVAAEMAPLLPVYPVRLVSRPGGGS